MSALLEVAGVFLKLGCSSFGGPVAHIGYLRSELVEKRQWIDDAHFGDVVALCQFLPGPASSQVVFALGIHRAGLLGGLVASACFTLPSALLMIAFAYGVAEVGDLSRAGWLHGLKLGAVVIVAQAVWRMGKSLCPDRARISLALLSAAVVLALPSAGTPIGVIFAGGIAGWWLYRRAITVAAVAVAPAPPKDPRRHVAAAGALAVFGLLLVGLPIVASVARGGLLEVWSSFYRSGALVFGGGHVVLPLLRTEIVPRGWLTDDQFLAGYGAAQALPGPMFAFAAYLGAAMSPGRTAWMHGLSCLVAIFLPAWLLVGGALPFWDRLRTKRWAQAALAGGNASVVGVLLAALYSPVIREGIHEQRDVVAALLAFGVLEQWRAPPWAVVLGLAATGQWLLV